MNDEKSAEQPDSSELPGGEKEQTGNKASVPKTNNNEVKKQELQDSFKRVHERSDKFNHEWDLKREAKKLDMKDEEYRNWYELSSKPLTWRSRFWGWTGFGEKKLWDILQIVIVPGVLAWGALYLQDSSKQREQAIADDKANQDTLVKYLDQMAELLQKGLKTKPNPETLIIAQAKTVIALQALDPKKQHLVIQFLDAANLNTLPGEKGILHEARMSKANLNRADLSWANLSKADLDEAKLSEASLSGANFSKANLGRANLSGSDLSGANLSKADLNEAKLINAKLTDANLNEAKLIGADLSKSKFMGAKLINANLNDANLSNADLSNANLFGAKLFGAKLISASLNGASLKEANLIGAIFLGANLNGADLSFDELVNANFSDAKLIKTNLSNAKLNFAKLSNAKLSNANLNDAKLIGADLSNADLSAANLSNANLEGAKNFSKTQKNKAKLCNTTLPDGKVSNRDCGK
jgi:uncharacterized protein YjbI with pentapeptide repeats